MGDKSGDGAAWIVLERTQDCVVVHVGGELDANVAGLLRQTIVGASPVHSLVIDLADVPFMDSSGLGAVISGLRHVRGAGGRAGIARPQAPIRHLLEMTGVDRLVPVESSTEAVVAAFSQEEPDPT